MMSACRDELIVVCVGTWALERITCVGVLAYTDNGLVGTIL